MINTTKTNDYLNSNTGARNMPEDSTILIDEIILPDLKDGCDQISVGKMKEFKQNDDLIQTEEVEDDVENSTSNDVYNDDEEEEERDLTNLTWLTELRNQTIGLVNMALDEETKKDNDVKTIAIEQSSNQQPSNIFKLSEYEIPLKLNTNILGQPNQRILAQLSQHKSDSTRATKILNQSKRPTPAERYEMFLNKIKRDLEIYEESAINYQSDVIEKPPFNYSHIIGMAMLENGRRVTLQQICSWIERKFAFFRVRKKWNNSIRHNLSLHPCFRKIGRNKEDKGKGGYWELGVDLKKCDRKRIRNRKSTAQANKKQKKHLQAHFMKTTKRKQQNLSIIKRFNYQNCKGMLKSFSNEPEFEELLLDEMDVQQNIDVMSTNTISQNDICDTSYEQEIKQQRQSVENDKEVMLSSFINGNDDDPINFHQKNDFRDLNENCSLSCGNNCHINEPTSEQTCQYKLGTIIITSANMDTDIQNIQNLNQPANNLFLQSHSTKELLTEHKQTTNNTHYSEDKDVPQNHNITISSYITDLCDDFNTSVQETPHNFSSPKPTNSITLDISAYPTQSFQQKPNVMVENLIPEPALSYSVLESSPDCMPTALSSSLNSAAAMCAIEAQNSYSYANGIANENFRPYIDGIDEAFQYLRSIDGARNEDILDNLLDISVSDY